MKSSLLAAQEENFSPQRSGYFVLFLIFFLLFFIMREKTMLQSPARRRTATILGYPVLLPSALSVCRRIVGHLAIATTQPPTSAEDHRLQLGPFGEATYYCYLPSRVNYLSNLAFI